MHLTMVYLYMGISSTLFFATLNSLNNQIQKSPDLLSQGFHDSLKREIRHLAMSDFLIGISSTLSFATLKLLNNQTQKSPLHE